jgi:hypothetical protein
MDDLQERKTKMNQAFAKLEQILASTKKPSENLQLEAQYQLAKERIRLQDQQILSLEKKTNDALQEIDILIGKLQNKGS